MGTRGLFGFYYKGKYYVVYNHFDSYPSGLGVDIVNELKWAIKAGKLDEWIALLEKIKIIDYDMKPTAEDIEKLKPYTDLRVSSQSTLDWYCLLRHCQGSLESVLNSGYLLNAVNSTGNPNWEEYAYIVNFDTKKLDFYISDRLEESFELDVAKLPNFAIEY